MGIKLMHTAVLLIIVFGSCAPNRKYKKSDFYVRPEDYINAYKVSFICGCINEGTYNSLNKLLVENKDPGLFSEIETISYFKVKEADSLGRVFSNRIKPINYEDAGYKKPIISGCIHLGLSKEVDSHAKKSYKQTLKNGD
jgi:hypothetical protein